MVVCKLPKLETPVRVTRFNEMKYFVYILKSRKDGNFYTGCTKNLESRFFRHNNGLVPSTRYRKPFDLVYKEEFDTKTEALKREKYLKSLEGGSLILRV